MTESYLVPYGELTEADAQEYIEQSKKALLDLAASELKISPNKVVIRDIQVAQDGSPNDWGDIQLANSVSANAQGWHIASASLSANQLANIINSGEKIDDNKWVVFYGVVDLSSEADLDAIQFERGSDTLQVVATEDIYAYENSPEGGIFSEPVLYEQNDPITIKLRYATTVEKHTVLQGFIAEQPGQRVSQ